MASEKHMEKPGTFKSGGKKDSEGLVDKNMSKSARGKLKAKMGEAMNNRNQLKGLKGKSRSDKDEMNME